jgi:hypothetical protein
MDQQRIPCTILIKRRVTGEPGPPSFLHNGELAFNEVDQALSIGTKSLSLSSDTQTE